jgi:hypothetical protein
MGESAGMTGSRVIGSMGHNPSSTQPTDQRMPQYDRDPKHTIFQNFDLLSATCYMFDVKRMD